MSGITVFDSSACAHMATREAASYAEGMSSVVVNGQVGSMGENDDSGTTREGASRITQVENRRILEENPISTSCEIF